MTDKTRDGTVDYELLIRRAAAASIKAGKKDIDRAFDEWLADFRSRHTDNGASK